VIDPLSKPTRQKIASVCLFVGIFLLLRNADPRIAVPVGIMFFLVGAFAAKRLAPGLMLLGLGGIIDGLVTTTNWPIFGGFAVAFAGAVMWIARSQWGERLPPGGSAPPPSLPGTWSGGN